MTPKLFSELGLSPELLKAIDKLGFEQAAPIQAEAIPLLMQGRDIVGQSQTGSGKTAAFAIPAIEKVDPAQRHVQVLILCPTRELAVQVSEEVHKLALFKAGVRALPIYGGQSYERQLYGLKQGAQVVIGTPGRVMDHMRRGTLLLDRVKLVVLDEADVMLDMGFREDIEFILQSTPPERQTVFFSATISRVIRELIEKYSREPQNVRIEQKSLTVPTVEQVYYEVDRRFKIELLTRLIDIHDLKLGIVFCNTKRMVDDLVDHLNAQGYSADRLHGDMTQVMRDRVMNKFRKSGLEFLVATDVAARGIDVDDVQVVFNYDLPYDPEDYVHRIGRTGRAGRSGRAISFVAGREVFQIRHIERFTNTRIHRARVPSREEVEEARANAFLDKLRVVLQSGEFPKQDHLVERLLEEGFSSTDISSALLHLLQGGEAAATPQHPTREDARPVRNPVPEPRQPRAPRAPIRDPREEPRDEPRPPAPAPEPPPALAPEQVAASLPDPAPIPAPTPAPAVQPARTRTPQPAERPSGKPWRTRTEADRAPMPRRPSTRNYSDATAAPAPFRRSASATPFARRPERSPAPAGMAPRASRRTPEQQTRLWLSLGTESGVGPGDVVGAILGETGLPANVVGTVDIRERHLFVDVASEHANGILAKLNRTRIRNQKLKAKVA